MNADQILSKAPPTPVLRPSASASAASANASVKLRNAAIISALIIVIGTIAGLVPRWERRNALRTETRELAIQTVSVVTPSIRHSNVESLPLPAEIKPWVEAPIYARASGYLKRFLVDIGSQVKEGDLLAEIDTPEINQELAQARAQLVQTQAEQALAKITAARWAGLLKSVSVSEQEVAEKQADLALKTATVDAAIANVHRLEELQSFQRIAAPFAGTITERATDVGMLIAAAGGKELFRLADTRKLRVYVRVPQTVAVGISPGLSAEIMIPELHGRLFAAKIIRTSGAMSADSRTLLTELEVDNEQGAILSGSYAQVRFAETSADPPLSLPANALLFRAEGPQVGVIGADEKVELRSVSLGRDFGPTIEILAGLTAKDRVIVNPSDSLVSGVKVRVATQ